MYQTTRSNDRDLRKPQCQSAKQPAIATVDKSIQRRVGEKTDLSLSMRLPSMTTLKLNTKRVDRFAPNINGGRESQSYVDDDNEPDVLLSPTFRWEPREELDAFA